MELKNHVVNAFSCTATASRKETAMTASKTTTTDNNNETATKRFFMEKQEQDDFIKDTCHASIPYQKATTVFKNTMATFPRREATPSVAMDPCKTVSAAGNFETSLSLSSIIFLMSDDKTGAAMNLVPCHNNSRQEDKDTKVTSETALVGNHTLVVSQTESSSLAGGSCHRCQDYYGNEGYEDDDDVEEDDDDEEEEDDDDTKDSDYCDDSWSTTSSLTADSTWDSVASDEEDWGEDGDDNDSSATSTLTMHWTTPPAVATGNPWANDNVVGVFFGNCWQQSIKKEKKEQENVAHLLGLFLEGTLNGRNRWHQVHHRMTNDDSDSIDRHVVPRNPWETSTSTEVASFAIPSLGFLLE